MPTPDVTSLTVRVNLNIQPDGQPIIHVIEKSATCTVSDGEPGGLRVDLFLDSREIAKFLLPDVLREMPKYMYPSGEMR